MKQATVSSLRLLRASVLGASSGLLLWACSSGTEPRDPEGLPDTGDVQLGLSRAESCDELLARVQDGFLAQLSERAEQLRAGDGYYYDLDDGGNVAVPPPRGDVAEGSSGGAGGSASSGGSPGAGEAPAGAPGPADPSSGGAGGFSGTTVQVRDVDEADIVKTDGDQIYLLHGSTLFALRGWPAAEAEVQSSTSIEGEPVEMFVKDGTAVVFSRVYRDVAAESGAQAGASRPYEYYGSAGYTKLTVLDMSGAEARVLRESYVEGQYVSSRRHDGLVRAVVQDGFKVPALSSPGIEYFDLFGERYPQDDIDAQVDAWLERTVRSVRSTEIADWLPREYVRSGGQLNAEAPRCGEYYSPDAGLTESGVTNLLMLDLNAPEAPLSGATILGHAERVYANEDVFLVTQSDYRFRVNAAASEQTIIHRFDIVGELTTYAASGAVAGSIHNQFSLDERDGIIRVSTTEQRFDNGGVSVGGPAIDIGVGMPSDPALDAAIPAPLPPAPELQDGPVNRVVTLKTVGTALVELGATEDFGHTERIFATRFIGDRAYVVTFRRTDPLFVVDLSDPAQPAVVGELVIPGFSDYLYPLGDDHLFAIGQDATDEGVVRGVALQIFDVSDPTSPVLTQRHVYQDYGASPANIDHRAISFHAERNLVAFPYQDYTTGQNTLEIFRVSPTEGFARLGGMGAPDTLTIEQCLERNGYTPTDAADAVAVYGPEWTQQMLAQCRSWQHFRRGLFRDNVVYGVANTGVFAYDLDALEAGALATVSLPVESYDYGYGGAPAPVPMPGIGGSSWAEPAPGAGAAGGVGGTAGSGSDAAPSDGEAAGGTGSGGAPSDG